MSSHKPKDPILFQIFDPVSRKGDDRRATILEAGVRVMAREGIAGLTFDALARESRMTRSHVAYYFPNKSVLIDQAIRFLSSKMQAMTVERVLAASTAEGRLDAMVTAAWDWSRENPDFVSAWLAYLHFCRRDRKTMALHTEIHRIGNERLAAILKELHPDRTERDLGQLARDIQALIRGALTNYWVQARPDPKEDVPGQLRSAIRRLRGVDVVTRLS